MKKVVFIVHDKCTGGFTSSLSSLYNLILNYYDVEVLQLSLMGDAEVSYQNVITKPNWLCDMFYSDYTRAIGFRKFLIGIIHCIKKIDKRLEARIAKHYTQKLSAADCIIGFGEGMASTFTQYIDHPNKVIWVHCDLTLNSRSLNELQLFKKFNHIICVSSIIANGLREMYPEIAHNIDSIHNVIDRERIYNLSFANVSESFHPVFNIISIGRIHPVKRFSLIPSIAKKLKDAGIEFKWWILGPAVDLEETNKMTVEIEHNNVNDCVEWIGNRQNPYPYIRKADLLVSTSLSEACPMIFTEARVLNTPIVSSDFKTAYEFIDDGIDGVISSIENMSDNIIKILTNEVFYCKIKQQSMKRGIGSELILKSFNKLVSDK